MKKTDIFSLAISVLFLASTFACADRYGFSVSNGQVQNPAPAVYQPVQNGPPAHAPAYGYRAKHMYMYQYYPSVSVYRDTGTGMYFYLSGSNWQVGATLPDALKVNLGSSVTLEMDTDKPYIYNDQHRQQYPPGQAKKNKKKNKYKNEKW